MDIFTNLGRWILFGSFPSAVVHMQSASVHEPSIQYRPGVPASQSTAAAQVVPGSGEIGRPRSQGAKQPSTGIEAAAMLISTGLHIAPPHAHATGTNR